MLYITYLNIILYNYRYMVSTSLSPSSPSNDKSGPTSGLLMAPAFPCCLVDRYSIV